MRRRTRHWLLGGTLALAAVGGLSWQLLRETKTAAIANAAPSPLPPPPAIQHCLAGAGAAGAAGSRGERRGAAAALAGG